MWWRKRETESAALQRLNVHTNVCTAGCTRDGEGWLNYAYMCVTGQRLVQRYLDAADDP